MATPVRDQNSSAQIAHLVADDSQRHRCHDCETGIQYQAHSRRQAEDNLDIHQPVITPPLRPFSMIWQRPFSGPLIHSRNVRTVSGRAPYPGISNSRLSTTSRQLATSPCSTSAARWHISRNVSNWQGTSFSLLIRPSNCITMRSERKTTVEPVP